MSVDEYRSSAAYLLLLLMKLLSAKAAINTKQTCTAKQRNTGTEIGSSDDDECVTGSRADNYTEQPRRKEVRGRNCKKRHIHVSEIDMQEHSRIGCARSMGHQV